MSFKVIFAAWCALTCNVLFSIDLSIYDPPPKSEQEIELTLNKDEKDTCKIIVNTLTQQLGLEKIQECDAIIIELKLLKQKKPQEYAKICKQYVLDEEEGSELPKNIHPTLAKLYAEKTEVSAKYYKQQSENKASIIETYQNPYDEQSTCRRWMKIGCCCVGVSFWLATTLSGWAYAYYQDCLE